MQKNSEFCDFVTYKEKSVCYNKHVRRNNNNIINHLKKGKIKNMATKLCTYLRFQKEREMYKDELNKLEIKKPLFIQSWSP